MLTNKEEMAQWRANRIYQYYNRITVEKTGATTSNVEKALEIIRQHMAVNHLRGEVWNGKLF